MVEAAQPIHSKLYTGTLRHRRHQPKQHAFVYNVFMPFLRLDELDRVLSLSPFWSKGRFAPARFVRDDFLGDPAVPLDKAVRQRIFQAHGIHHTGPIYLLANLRYFGYQINPISCYYCYDETETRLEYLVAEVTNTPWGERHSYVLRGDEGQRVLREEFAKDLHVSPFNPMEMHYSWRSNCPGRRLAIHLENHSNGERIFDATLALSGEAVTRRSLHRVLWKFPFMTAKVALAIYWQALKLFIKRVPIHRHPGERMHRGAQQ